ncbi:hypothetical protein J4Q44_G00386360 [Coregonus suidteri]|uniref:Uncharacterized protein n=1 Tax=Coregonus suidteri TaxID=861788 RepID=A0AAN8K9P8_9TELE
MESVFEGLEGIWMILGSTMQEHNERLEKTAEGSEAWFEAKSGCVNEITFLGDKLSSESVQPDHAKVKSVREMANPTDRKGIQSVLGMVNYLGMFVPNL